MRSLICDSGPLIAQFIPADRWHRECVRLLADFPGKLVIPEPVVGETCTFLRNAIRHYGPELEARFLESLVSGGDTKIKQMTHEDHVRAAELVRRLVSAPLGYTDAAVIAQSERLELREIATVDYRFVGMASQVSRLKPLRWLLQEGWR